MTVALLPPFKSSDFFTSSFLSKRSREVNLNRETRLLLNNEVNNRIESQRFRSSVASPAGLYGAVGSGDLRDEGAMSVLDPWMMVSGTGS
jgi:hypothetical protein